MYEKNFTKLIQNVVSDLSLKSTYGDVFWVNNSAVPNGSVYQRMAEGFSNEKVCFKGVTKTGIAELMAVHHRAGQSPYKLTSAMVGIITDSVIRRQVQHEQYSTGVTNLITVVFDSFKLLSTTLNA